MDNIGLPFLQDPPQIKQPANTVLPAMDKLGYLQRLNICICGIEKFGAAVQEYDLGVESVFVEVDTQSDQLSFGAAEIKRGDNIKNPYLVGGPIHPPVARLSGRRPP